MFIVHTDSATCFAVSDTAQGHGHRRLYGPGPHLLQSDVWAQPGGPRGTSDIRKLAAGSVIIRVCAGDEYTCAQWRVITPDGATNHIGPAPAASGAHRGTHD